jgi:23S rRNA (cytosine1962-C5)-methyltransferase
MSNLVKVILKSGKDISVKRFHPWIFSGAIKKMSGKVEEGEMVEVYSNKDEFLGIGHFQIGSIAIRIVSFQNVVPDVEFWKSKFWKAYLYRKSIGIIDNPETNVYRLIHAEGDNMPGLIVDYYDGIIVLQAHSVGMYKLREQFTDILKEIYGDNLKGVYDKSTKTLPFKADIQPVDQYLYNSKNKINYVTEYGQKFKINWVEGQKTGFFIDQRENRKLLQHYSKGKDVLNVFGYTGGFSVYALAGGAKTVHSVDSSKSAIELTNHNVDLNFGEIDNHESYDVDAFKYLNDMSHKYDVIVLDPPAFAKHQNVLSNALQGYKRINLSALKQIKKSGILFTFSCSQAVSKENFKKTIFSAAALSGREVKILHQLTQPADHPVNIYHPEGEYLKGLVLYVN